MKVEIPQTPKINVSAREFEEIVKGRQNLISRRGGLRGVLKVGDTFIISEFTEIFTGREIRGLVTKIDDRLMYFRKIGMSLEGQKIKVYE